MLKLPKLVHQWNGYLFKNTLPNMFTPLFSFGFILIFGLNSYGNNKIELINNVKNNAIEILNLALDSSSTSVRARDLYQRVRDGIENGTQIILNQSDSFYTLCLENPERLAFVIKLKSRSKWPQYSNTIFFCPRSLANFEDPWIDGSSPILIHTFLHEAFHVAIGDGECDAEKFAISAQNDAFPDSAGWTIFQRKGSCKKDIAVKYRIL